MRGALVPVALALVAGCARSAPTTHPAAQPTHAPDVARDSGTPLQRLETSRDLDNAVIGSSHTPTVVMSLASWCEHCRAELDVFDQVRVHVPRVRWLGLNYKGHEEYDDRGSPEAIRELAHATPWMRIVPADDALFTAFGSPPKVPTIYVYDSAGTLVETFDREKRPPPDEPELEKLLSSLP